MSDGEETRARTRATRGAEAAEETRRERRNNDEGAQDAR